MRKYLKNMYILSFGQLDSYFLPKEIKRNNLIWERPRVAKEGSKRKKKRINMMLSRSSYIVLL